MSALTKELDQAAIGALKYLEGTKDYKLALGANRNKKKEFLKGQEKANRVIAYGDADFVSCVKTGRSVFWPVFWSSSSMAHRLRGPRRTNQS
jgi:hypothetical protein